MEDFTDTYAGALEGLVKGLVVPGELQRVVLGPLGRVERTLLTGFLNQNGLESGLASQRRLRMTHFLIHSIHLNALWAYCHFFSFF